MVYILWFTLGAIAGFVSGIFGARNNKKKMAELEEQLTKANKVISTIKNTYNG